MTPENEALGREALEQANIEMGLALSASEIEYLLDNFRDIGRNPTDVELMMFAQLILNTVATKYLILTGQLMARKRPTRCST